MVRSSSSRRRLPIQRSMKQFATGVRGGVFVTRMPSVWKISSKLAVNRPARSRSRILQPLNASALVRNRFLTACIHRRKGRGCTRRDGRPERRPRQPGLRPDFARPPVSHGRHRNTPPATARCASPWSSTRSAAGSWAGPSPIISAQSWSSTPCRWPSGDASHPPARPSPTPITAPGQYTSWGVRTPPPRRRAARLDGLDRRLLR